jgi:hypothetical protein
MRMSDEKKPKIDLKSRLQKVGGGTSAGPGALPIPPGGVPVPVGFGEPQGAAAASPNESQRIEIDESAVSEARDAARKGMRPLIIIGTVVGVALGFVSGTGYETKSAVSKSKDDATQLKKSVDKAKDQAKTLADKLEAGRQSLLRDRKFPDKLASELRDAKIGFGGDELALRRFSAFPSATTRDLVDFVTRVQSANDKREFVQRLLTRLEKPIKAELAAGPAASNFRQVVVLDKDSLQKGAFISVLSTPSKIDNVPAKLTFTGPNGKPAELARLTELKVPDKGGAIPVNPVSYNAICPNETQGEIAQLIRQITTLRNEVRPEKAASSDPLEAEAEAGLVVRAERLSEALGKI